MNLSRLHLIRRLHHAPIYPILLTVYPILFLYAFNINEVTLDMLWLPLVAALVLAAGLLLVAKRVMMGWNRAALWFTGFGVLFFGYGHLTSLLDPSFGLFGIQFSTDLVILTIFGVVLTGFSWWLWRNHHFSLGHLNVAINVMSFMLVMMSAIHIIPAEIGKHAAQSQNYAGSTAQAAPMPTTDASQKPDVYYLVFDRYASNKSLQELYGFDNSAFYQMLKDKGFYVAEESTANYPSTSFSLSSTLNMQYHQRLDTSGANYPTQATHIYPLLKNYEVGKAFKQQGYRIVQLGSWFTYTHQDGIADENYALSSDRQVVKLDSFTSKLLSTTAAEPVLEQVAPGIIKNNNFESHYLFAEYERQKFPEIAAGPGPKFVFAHILVPHDPFVYDANCQKADQKTVESEENIIGNYTDMVQCANKIAGTMLDQIRTSAKEQGRPDPVILIQADEGPYPLKEYRKEVGPYDSKTTEQLQERFRILNAYYIPGQKYDTLYQSITPVNSFRIVLSQLFNTHYELLPDKNYRFKDGEHLFDYIDVTEQLQK